MNGVAEASVEDACVVIDSILSVGLTIYCIDDVYTRCEKHASHAMIHDVMYNTNSYANLLELLGKHDRDVSELVYLGSGTEAVIYKLDEHVVKITGNPPQCIEARVLVDVDNDYIVDILDVVGNAILMEFIYVDKHELLEYTPIINAIYNGHDITHTNIKNPKLRKVLSDVQRSKSAYMDILGLDEVDVYVINIGRNTKDNYIIFDW